MNRVLGLLLIGLAVAACLSGWQYGWIGRAIGMQFAVSFILVGIAYFGVLPGVYAKQSDGIRPVWNQLALLPHSLLAAMSFRLSVWMAREPAIARLEPTLYFGRRLLGHDLEKGLTTGWVGVLDLAGEFTEDVRLRSLPYYQSLPVLDGSAPSPKQLDMATNWIFETMERGPVFVHCALGHGRTATILIAYMLKTGAVDSFQSGFEKLRLLRRGVSLNRLQQQALLNFEASLHPDAGDED